MAEEVTRAPPEPVRPDSLAAAERALLLNIETHTNWSDSGVVTALFEKGLITRLSGGQFVLTDHGRTALDGLLQHHRRVAEGARERLATGRYRTERRD